MDEGLFAKLLEIDLIQGDNNWENIKSKIIQNPRWAQRQPLTTRSISL